jgi:cbb3-type cytochrome oxidase subunit 1
MDWFVKNFVKASLTWFGLGATLGLCMALEPAWVIYRPAHFHMNMLGFVTMMIYGVAYHVMPRFTGHPLHSPRLAGVQWWVSNAGLALLVLGFALAPHVGGPGTTVLVVGGVASALGAYAFIYNLWRTLDGRPAPRRTVTPPDVVNVHRARSPVRGAGES